MVEKYGFWGFLQLIINITRTRLFYPSARLIRFPISIRGHKYIDMGKQLTTGNYCRLEAYPFDKKSKVLLIGNNIQINDSVHITAMQKVFIGDNVLIASKVYISDCSHGSYKGDCATDSDPETLPAQRPYFMKPVIIEDNVWIGEFVSVLPGVTIGRGSIIGTMSVVTKDIPPYCIAIGSPAVPIKKYNFETKLWEKINN